MWRKEISVVELKIVHKGNIDLSHCAVYSLLTCLLTHSLEGGSGKNSKNLLEGKIIS